MRFNHVAPPLSHLSLSDAFDRRDLCPAFVDTLLIQMDTEQAFENTSTNVAASQMRNALNGLADTVTDASEKKRFGAEMDNFFTLFRRYLNDKAKSNTID